MFGHSDLNLMVPMYSSTIPLSMMLIKLNSTEPSKALFKDLNGVQGKVPYVMNP